MDSGAEPGPCSGRAGAAGALARVRGESCGAGGGSAPRRSGRGASGAGPAIRRGELTVLEGAGPEIVYETAVRCFLELGRPSVLVDGACVADPYEVAEIAGRVGAELAAVGEEWGGGEAAGADGEETAPAG
ncbi:MAG: hypothetical protein ACUVV6_06440, partial [Thermoplasmatota archaeon]